VVQILGLVTVEKIKRDITKNKIKNNRNHQTEMYAKICTQIIEVIIVLLIKAEVSIVLLIKGSMSVLD
jgi:hypothetical protein